MLKLLDLIRLAGVTLEDYKIHCATGFNPTPLEAFYENSFKQWQEYQTKKNFEREHILSLIAMGDSDWLFAGVYKVDGVMAKSGNGESWFEYSTTEISGLDHLSGKAIITFDKKFRASYLKGERYADNLTVKEIRPLRQSIGDFPGYNNIRLSFRNLNTIISQEIQSWKTALSNVAGIYLIADILTGKHYIGSAYGDEGVWQRWSAYAASGHGNNKEPRKLLQEHGAEYSANFQFTMLEVIDLNASREHVLARETHWKETLLTRSPFGYNSN